MAHTDASSPKGSRRFFTKSLLLRLAVLALIGAIFAGLLAWGYLSLIRPQFGNTVLWAQKLPPAPADSGVPLENGQTLSQEFTHTGILNAVMVGLHYSVPVAQEGAFYEVALYDAVTDTLLDTVSCDISIGYATPEHGFVFPHDHKTPLGRYRVTVTPQGFAEDMQITLVALNSTSADFCTGSTLLNGEDTGFVSLLAAGANAVHIRGLFFLLGLVLLAVTGLLACIWLFCRRSLTIRFVLSALLLGVLFALVFPPYASYDEDHHYGTAYYYAQKLLYPAQTEAIDAYATAERDHTDFTVYALPARTADTQGQQLPIYYRVGSLYHYYARLDTSFGHANDMAGTLRIGLFRDASPLAYFPAIAGILLGRLLGVSGDLLPGFARLGMYLAYTLLCALGISIAPKGRQLLVFASLLPSALLIACSAANDLFHCGTGILLIGIALSLSDKDRPLRPLHIAGLLFCFVMMLASSQLQLLPLFLWIGWLLVCRRAAPHHRRRLAVGLASAAAAALALWAAAVCTGTLHLPADISSYTELGLLYPLCRPFEAISLLLNTAWQDAGLYLTQWTGSLLGWGNLDTGVFALFLLLLSALLTGAAAAQELTLPPLLRTGAHITGLAVIALSFCVGFVWTSYAYLETTGTLWGVQGRYFLCAMPLLLLGLPPIRRLPEKMLSPEVCGLGICLADCYILTRSLLITLSR